MSNYFVIVSAAGKGTRLGGIIPKQYLEIYGKRLIEYSLNVFLDLPFIEKVVVVVSSDDTYWHKMAIAAHPKILTAIGESERSGSVLNGLLALAPYIKEQDWVMVHDAARPCLHQEDVHKLVTFVADHAVGGCLGSPVRDTLKKCGPEGNIQNTVSRQDLWHALTPQMFRYRLLLNALQSAQQAVTDEASAMELLALTPMMVPGRADNIKVTLPGDIELVEHFLRRYAE